MTVTCNTSEATMTETRPHAGEPRRHDVPEPVDTAALLWAIALSLQPPVSTSTEDRASDGALPHG